MKDKKAFFLLEEMSGISDSIVTAAEKYPSAAKRRRRFVRFVSAAAVVLIIFTAAMMRRTPDEQMESDKTVLHILQNADAELYTYDVSRTDEASEAAESSDTRDISEGVECSVAVDTSEGVECSDTNKDLDESYDPATDTKGCMLVWRTNDGKLYRKQLTKRQFEVLSSYIGKGKAADASYDAQIKGMWLVSEDGVVRSPYLKNNSSNFAVGVLFDYSPEVIPSKGFVSALQTILE